MIYIRRVGEVADGSVTASKLADGAVDLDTAWTNRVSLEYKNRYDV